jgi:hypothetical protein
MRKTTRGFDIISWHPDLVQRPALALSAGPYAMGNYSEEFVPVEGIFRLKEINLSRSKQCFQL